MGTSVCWNDACIAIYKIIFDVKQYATAQLIVSHALLVLLLFLTFSKFLPPGLLCFIFLNFYIFFLLSFLLFLALSLLFFFSFLSFFSLFLPFLFFPFPSFLSN